MRNLSEFFKVSIFASGTPADFQNQVGNQFKQNVCACSPKTAIENGWIKAPTLNLVNGHLDQWPHAILTVLHNEVKNYSQDGFPTRILANFSGIDEIDFFHKLNVIQNRIGKEFHIITIHSPKPYAHENEKCTVKCKKDNVVIDANEAYKEIEKIDYNECFDDDLPIIVCQVNMIGEGINVRSFNAVLTSSNSDKKVMQQVGRGMRDYEYSGKTKVKDGHCNLYVLYENKDEVGSLLKNLEEHELTEDCFSWGKRVDITTSSPTGKLDEDALNALNNPNWKKIDPKNDLEIMLILEALDKKMSKKAIDDFIDTNLQFNPDEVNALMEHLKKAGLEKFYGWAFNAPSRLLLREIQQLKRALTENAVLKSVWNINEKENRINVCKRVVQDEYFAKWLIEHMTTRLEQNLECK